MAKRITFSIRDKDTDIEAHLKSKVNYSDYIRGLIKSDMTGNVAISIEQRILNILEGYTKVNANTLTNENKCFIDDMLNLGV